MNRVNNDFYAIGTTVQVPPAGYRTIYPKNTGWYEMDENGTETALGGGGAVGPGTTNYYARFVGSTSIGDGLVYDDASFVYITYMGITGDRMLEASSTGKVTSTRQIISAYGVPNTEKLKLENASNWDVNGQYTGTAITGTYQGQKHYTDNYFYEAVGDNVFIRLIRG